MLLAGFPAAEKLDPAFAKLAAADVGAAEPSIGALAAVARKLRRTWLPEFGRQVPSISEILAALNAEEKRLASAVAAINWMPKRIAEAKRQIEELIAERDHRRRQASSDIRRRIEAGKDTDDLNWSFPGLVDEVRAEMEANQGENR
jgi:hypothetical protein